MLTPVAIMVRSTSLRPALWKAFSAATRWTPDVPISTAYAPSATGSLTVTRSSPWMSSVTSGYMAASRPPSTPEPAPMRGRAVIARTLSPPRIAAGAVASEVDMLPAPPQGDCSRALICCGDQLLGAKCVP
eukprot:3806310-Amphidinium_carterae.1